MDKEVREAAGRAADWLEANPDKHIGKKLATDDTGLSVSTLSPDATCFCAVGRWARELGIDTRRINYGLRCKIGGDFSFGSVFLSNDRGIEFGDKSLGILALRRVAETGQ